MARIRSVHPGLFTDEAFVSVSPHAKLLLIGLWTEADDRGIFEWKPLRMRLRLFPGQDKVNIPEWLQELVEADCIAQFTADAKEYGAVRNFCKWQRPRQPEFLYPSGGMDGYVGLDVRVDREQTDRGTALGKIIAERDGFCCRYCGNGVTPYRKKANSLEIDHAIPISRGGTDDYANLAAACKPCNERKANMTADEFTAKFARDELRESSVSRIGDHVSQSAKTVSHDAKDVSQNFRQQNAEMKMQREDGGGKREEGEEKKEADLRTRDDFERFHQALLAIPGITGQPIAVDPNLAPLWDLAQKGFDVDKQILPSIERQLAKAKRRIGQWSYFVAGIREDAEQASQAGKGAENGQSGNRKPTAADEMRAGIASVRAHVSGRGSGS